MDNVPYFMQQEPKDNFPFLKVLALIALLLLVMSLCFSKAKAQVCPAIDLSIISKIESSNNPLAVGKAGEIGTFQLMPCVLVDYNRRNASNLGRNDLFNPEINKKIALWYLTVELPRLLKFYHKPITTENLIWSWNAGIGNLVKGRCPKSTQNYIKRYILLDK